MYKDIEKQREATKLRVRRYRERLKSVTDDVTPCKNVTPLVTPCVTPIIKTKADAVKAVEKIVIPDWRILRVVECRKFSEKG